jgi:hypothetical protein
MQTTLRSAFITDLLLPPPHSLPTLSPAQIRAIGHTTAQSLLRSSEDFIRLNPLVTNVRPIFTPSDSKQFVDVPTFCAEFNIHPSLNPAISVSGKDEWTHFEITDKLNFGLGSTDLVYCTAIRALPTGFESLTNPGSGVRIYGRFEILLPSELGRLTQTPMEQGAVSELSHVPEEAGGGEMQQAVLHYIEHNETKCNTLLSLYIKATNAKSHRAMHEAFKRKWGENVKFALAEAVKNPLPANAAGPAVPPKDGHDRNLSQASSARIGIGTGHERN